MTRLDRVEPHLNEATPGDPRDTTTPMAMLGNIQKLVLGDALSAPSKALLTKWMLGCKTCDTRLRAGLPSGWKTGGKTGTGEHGSTNDIGVIWPPVGRRPSSRSISPGRRHPPTSGMRRLPRWDTPSRRLTTPARGAKEHIDRAYKKSPVVRGFFRRIRSR
jgi:hypothetical protein